MKSRSRGFSPRPPENLSSLALWLTAGVAVAASCGGGGAGDGAAGLDGEGVDGLAAPYQRVFPPGTMRVVEVETGRRIGRDMRIAEPTRRFEPHDPIYVVVITEGGEPGARLDVRWRTREGEVLGRDMAWVGAGRQYVELSPPPLESWPLGSYAADLLVDGRPVASAEFDVVEEVERGWFDTGRLPPGG